MSAPREIIELVKRFDYNIEAYKSGNYKEAQLRLEFLNPFFEADSVSLINRIAF